MNIELRPLSDIKPYERNPRHNDDSVEAVARSIREFGFRQPIVVDGDGVIVVGHTRWKAAQSLGLERVPVHVAKELTPEQAKAYRIADNQTATIAEWNLELLPGELAELQQLDVDLSLLGFDEDELARLLDPGVKEGLTDPDEIPEPPDAAITQPGDLWILGDHRLLCSDSASVVDVNRLLASEPNPMPIGATADHPSTSTGESTNAIIPIHLINTDPPYNVKIEPRSNNAIAAGLSSFGSSNTPRRAPIQVVFKIRYDQDRLSARCPGKFHTFAWNSAHGHKSTPANAWSIARMSSRFTCPFPPQGTMSALASPPAQE